MKRLFLLVLVVALAAGAYLYKEQTPGSPAGSPAAALEEGATAPDFSLRNLQNREVRLSDLRGKIVLVNFWATWCPPCVEEIPSMDRLYGLMKGKDFEMLAINVEGNGRATVPNFLKTHKASFPILFDEQAKVQDLYGVHRFPETFILDRDGRVLDKIIGGRTWDDPTIVDYLNFLLRGKS